MYAEGNLGKSAGGEDLVPGLWIVSERSSKIVNTPAVGTPGITELDQFIPYILGERNLCLWGQDKGQGEGQGREEYHRTWRRRGLIGELIGVE